jgi:hypothetical protein
MIKPESLATAKHRGRVARIKFSNSPSRKSEGPPNKAALYPYVFMDWKNSPFVFVDFNLSIRNSIPSIVPIGFKMRRST